MSKSFKESSQLNTHSLLKILVLLLLVNLISTPSFAGAKRVTPGTDQFVVMSDHFEAGDQIPREHTCDGEDRSPSLRWMNSPKETQSYTVVLEDLDAPDKTWIHWILWDIPPTINYLPPGFPPIKKLGNAERHGQNDFGKLGYRGPCPPSGEHRYVFRVYALDEMLRIDNVEVVTHSILKEAIQGHVLAEAELIGKYSRNG